MGLSPAGNTALTAIPGSNGWAQAAVIFPPGSPDRLFYKYSGRIAGTNNYEAIRLTVSPMRPAPLRSTPMAPP